MINELLEEEEDDIQMFDTYMKKKKGSEIMTSKIH